MVRIGLDPQTLYPLPILTQMCLFTPCGKVEGVGGIGGGISSEKTGGIADKVRNGGGRRRRVWQRP